MNFINIPHNLILNRPGLMNTNVGCFKRDLAGSLITKSLVILSASLAFVLFTASSQADDLEAKSSNPKPKFADTDTTSTCGTLPGNICLPVWVITGNLSYFRLMMDDPNQGYPGERLYIDDYADMELNWGPGRWAVQDEDEAGHNIFVVRRDAPLSLEIEDDGDVSLADGDLFVDTSQNYVGIVTSSPRLDLEIRSPAPRIMYDSTSADSTEWAVGNLNNDFTFATRANGTGGPAYSVIMNLDAETGYVGMPSGRLGIGTNTPSEAIHVQSNNPKILFDDSDETGSEWTMTGGSGAFSMFNHDTNKYLMWLTDDSDMQIEMGITTFELQDETNNTIVRVHRDSPLSLDVQSDGNISLAGGGVFIDRTSNWVGIGTTTPGYDLEIQSGEPQMYFDDTSPNSTNWRVGNLTNDFIFETIFNSTGGPSGQIMTLDAQTGYIAMNVESPAAALHVGSPDGTQAKVLIENTTSTVAPRTLFEMKNAGNTKFSVNNIDAGVEWSFANPGTGFRLSRRGSGVVEFEVFNNGDVHVAGTLTQGSDKNSKQGIKAIDTTEILEKVVSMPISEWRYKDAPDARHLGPMAQDFYTAFGLGNTDTGISSLDSSGVAFAAIQALAERNQVLEERVAELELESQRINELEAIVLQLKSGKSKGILFSN